jgi:hypothetical protein
MTELLSAQTLIFGLVLVNAVACLMLISLQALSAAQPAMELPTRDVPHAQPLVATPTNGRPDNRHGDFSHRELDAQHGDDPNVYQLMR